MKHDLRFVLELRASLKIGFRFPADLNKWAVRNHRAATNHENITPPAFLQSPNMARCNHRKNQESEEKGKQDGK